MFENHKHICVVLILSTIKLNKHKNMTKKTHYIEKLNKHKSIRLCLFKNYIMLNYIINKHNIMLNKLKTMKKT